MNSSLLLHYMWLIPVGFIIGGYGTLIGAGGGFVLMPFLLMYYPDDAPSTLTSISLAVVFFNALSGSYAYARMKRVDFKSGIIFSAASVPGAIAGAFASEYVPRHIFNLMIGLLMVAISIYLIARPEDKNRKGIHKLPFHYMRTIIERDGTIHLFSFNVILGILWSVFVGFFSSLLGIGGGIIHVPVLARLLNFPIHIATATSHFTLAWMSMAGTLVHIGTGAFSHGVNRTVFLAIGVLAGAQIGAHFSSRVKSKGIIRSLAVALGLVGLRLLFSA